MTKIGRDNFNVFNDNWALVTSGTPESFNTMTVSWGSFGCLWGIGKPHAAMQIVTVYIKPARYTHGFLEKNELFTVSFFPKEYKEDLSILGSVSGRDCDKLALTKLTPKVMAEGKAIGFREASCTIVLKKIYSQPMDRKNIPEDIIRLYYKTDEPHTVFIGEVISIENYGNE